MLNDDFAVFIITNGRPDKVVTYETLKKSGYSGRIYLLVDDLDPTREKYIENYGDQVVIFDKRLVAKTFDIGDNFDDLRSSNYGRNASFDVATNLGIKYFIQLDDDYTGFQYRFDENLKYLPKTLKNIDEVFGALLTFYKRSGAETIAMAQGGDFIGGDLGTYADAVTLKRKCMNSFICSTERRFRFVGRLNEDVNTYITLGSVGKLFFTVNQVNLNQLGTQSNAGGMTEIYLESGTYVKSFYSVMYHPSSVKVGILRGRSSSRLHHKVSWKNTTPMILRESQKKS